MRILNMGSCFLLLPKKYSLALLHLKYVEGCQEKMSTFYASYFLCKGLKPPKIVIFAGDPGTCPHGCQGTPEHVFRMARSTFDFSTKCLTHTVHLYTSLFFLKWVPFDWHWHSLIGEITHDSISYFRTNKFLVLNFAGVT